MASTSCQATRFTAVVQKTPINHPRRQTHFSTFRFAFTRSSLIWLQSHIIREFEMSSSRRNGVAHSGGWRTVIFNPFFRRSKLSLQNTATKRNDEEKQFRLMENFHKFRSHCDVWVRAKGRRRHSSTKVCLKITSEVGKWLNRRAPSHPATRTLFYPAATSQ